jgi:hypothetical protein
MRYALISLWMIGFVCLVTGLTEPPASAQVPPNTVVVTSDKTGTHFTVVGPYQTTSADAWQAALDRARQEVIGQLQSDGIVEFQPSMEYVRTQLVQSKKEEVKELSEPVGQMRRVTLEISISPQQRKQMIQLDKEKRHHDLVRERMATAGIALVGLVAVLGAVAGYLRLDELTKGYYTGWLLVGAGLVGAAAVAGVVVILFLIA